MKIEEICFSKPFEVVHFPEATFMDLVREGEYDETPSHKNGALLSEEWFEQPVSKESPFSSLYRLAFFSRKMMAFAAQRAFVAQNIQSASARELLEFGAMIPQLQRDFDIVSVGAISDRSTENHPRYMIRLSGGIYSRKIGFASTLDGLESFTRFLVRYSA